MSETFDFLDVNGVGSRKRLAAFASLTKPRIAGMVLIATAAGFYMGLTAADGTSTTMLLAHAVLGTALVAGGANALNQYLEVEFDRRMARTESRPLPSGAISPVEGLAFALTLSVGGVAYLACFTNALAASLALLAVGSYAFLYTPLKRLTPWCVFVGAVPGALPPVIGWAAAAGSIGVGAFLLFAILFFWQLPHFAAIAWLYREDYAKAGYPMLSVVDPDGTRTSLHVVTHTIALLAASLLPAMYGINGSVYAVGAMLLGTMFLAFGVWFARRKTRENARMHLLASVAYLPMLFALMLMDKSPVW